jgi:hypothetical protein
MRTYNDLLEFINSLTPEQREMEVAVHLSYIDESVTLVHDYPFLEGSIDIDGEFTDEKQPYLVI